MRSWFVAGGTALGLLAGSAGAGLRAQQVPAGGARPWLDNRASAPRGAPGGVRRVNYQETPGPPGAPSGTTPSAGGAGAAGDTTAPPGAGAGTNGARPGGSTEPLRSNTDLSLPAAEREGFGGEPTTATAEAEKAEEAKAEEPAAEETPKDPTKLLMNALGLEDSPVKLYGWIENSYTFNTNGTPRNGLNFGVNPNFLANRWMGNQYYIILENPLEMNDTINFGFRADNLFGNDWQFNHSHGFLDTVAKPNHFNGYDLAQVYGEVHLPFLTKGGLDVKGGRFYTILGYEVVPAIARPLLSVPYMFNYGQPFTHFGMLSTLHVNDRLNWYNGVVNGWDRWVNDTYKWNYLGGINWTSKNGKFNAAISYIIGPNQFPRFLPANTVVVPTGTTPPPFLAGRRNLGYGSNWRTTFTTVLSYKWTDTFTQVIETDESIEKNVPGFGPGGTPNDAEWYSFGNWFLWQVCKKESQDILTLVWRSEVFRDNNGVRTGFADNFYEQTVGYIFKPKPWLWFRNEFRYDWAQFTHPYNDGTRNSQFTIGMDLILLY